MRCFPVIQRQISVGNDLPQSFHRACTVAEGVFHVGGKFCEGGAVAFWHEQGIVAEAAVAFFLISDDSFDAAIATGDDFAIPRQHQNAAEPGAAFFAACLCGFQLSQKFFAICGISRAFAAVACGVDSGGAIEGIDFQA